MYKIIKHSWEDRNKIYVSSDWHAYHDPQTWDSPIWEMRGYLNAEHAKEEKIRVINERVPEDGILYFLGDGFLNATDEQCKNWLTRIICKDIRYLFGNHESCMYRIYKEEIKKQYNLEGVEIYPLKMDNVTFYGNHLEVWIGKQRIVMNHFPLHTFHKCAHGSINLHGHSHNNDKTRNPDYHLGKTLDCSWDWKCDVWSFLEIMEIMSTKDIYVTDHRR